MQPGTVDCHLHLAESSAQTPVWWMEELYRPYGGEYIWPDGAAVVELLDRAGIELGMIQGSDLRRTTFDPDHPTEREHHVSHDYVAHQCELFPGRLMGVVTVDPLRDMHAAVAEQRRCVEQLGFKSSKFLPTYQNYYINDPELAPMLEGCLDLDIVAHVNTGYSPTITAALKYGHPEYLDDIGIKYRDLRTLVVLNFPYVREGIAVVARHPNFYADICYLIGAGPVPLFEVLSALRSFDALDRVVYGSDNNDKDRVDGAQQIGTALLDQINAVATERGKTLFTSDELASIVGGTAGRLYGLN